MEQPDIKADGNSIYEQLRNDILSCRLPPGVQIYEQDLGRRFGVSKSPVREALVRLRDQNLVEVKPKSGYRVRPISLTEVTEMYEIRSVYEVACVELAIDHYDELALAHLAQVASVTGAATASDWVAINNQFHDLLALCCGNKRLAQIATDLISQFARFTHISLSRMVEPQSFDDFAADHMAIVAAMRERNKKSAVRAIKRHIEASRKRTLDALTTPICVT